MRLFSCLSCFSRYRIELGRSILTTKYKTWKQQHYYYWLQRFWPVAQASEKPTTNSPLTLSASVFLVIQSQRMIRLQHARWSQPEQKRRSPTSNPHQPIGLPFSEFWATSSPSIKQPFREPNNLAPEEITPFSWPSARLRKGLFLIASKSSKTECYPQWVPHPPPNTPS